MPSIFLIGFMAAGKTSLGRELARRLDRPLIDLDEQIESNEGMTITEIFSSRGEAAFRALEAAALQGAIARGATEACVVATGGGVAAVPENLAAMRAAGLVIELSAPLETLLARAGAGGGETVRPLLAAGSDAIAELFARRAPAYRRAHASLMTDESSITTLADRAIELDTVASTLGARLERASICAIPERAVPIASEAGCLDDLGDLLATFAPTSSRVAIVSDTNVAPLYLARARASIDAAGASTVTEIIAAGEASKNPAEHARLAAALVGAGLDRKSVIIALGGGVVGDLAGYVAATLFRGIRVIQVPTTLVAMTDSAIGGKTGVNLVSGKNLLGAFWQPSLVVIDPTLLDTLPPRELLAGYGELFKVGLLDGRELFELVGETRRPGGADRSERLAAVVRRCAAYKSWVVSRDAREQTGQRAWLNLGHTVGHAIERAAGYGRVLHGEAVGLGLIAAARVSHAVGVASEGLEVEVTTALAAAGMDTNVGAWLRPDVLAHIGVDKKRTGKHLAFVVLRDVGVPEIAQVPVSDVTKFLLAP